MRPNLVLALLAAIAACNGGGAGSPDTSTTAGATTGSDDGPPSTGDGTGASTGSLPATTDTGSSDGADESTGGEPRPEPIDCTMVSCVHVRADARRGGDGSSWDAALPQVPAEPERGAVYFVADGEYGGLVLDAPESGRQTITILKATAADHGTEIGWDPAYGDGQALFPDVVMVSDFWVLDGATRDETDWSDVDAYGFRIAGGITAHTINFGRGSNDVLVRHVDIGGPPTGVFDRSIPGSGFYFGGFDMILARWTISRVHVHDVGLPFQLAGASDITIEHSWLGPNWSKETIRGQGHASRITIRHNVLKDGCQGTPGDPTAPGCTGQIAMWDGDTPGDFDGSEIYGNLIWTTKDTGHSDACILVGGDGGISAQGVAANDVRIYNNTFVGIAAGRCSLRCPGEHEGDEIVNNLWFDLGEGVGTDCDADVCETNEDLTGAASPFVDAAAGDFRLAVPTSPGTVLPAPYDVDRTGAVRGADGTWDLGAWEHAR